MHISLREDAYLLQPRVCRQYIGDPFSYSCFSSLYKKCDETGRRRAEYLTQRSRCGQLFFSGVHNVKYK